MTPTFARCAVFFAVGFLAVMALDGGNSFAGYWGDLWLAGMCAQISGLTR
jgi:hypothetical protein